MQHRARERERERGRGRGRTETQFCSSRVNRFAYKFNDTSNNLQRCSKPARRESIKTLMVKSNEMITDNYHRSTIRSRKSRKSSAGITRIGRQRRQSTRELRIISRISPCISLLARVMKIRFTLASLHPPINPAAIS